MLEVGFLPRPSSLSGDHDPRLADIKALCLTRDLVEDYAMARQLNFGGFGVVHLSP
jgi:hypothetical protein